jgi:hypothetical protein
LEWLPDPIERGAVSVEWIGLGAVGAEWFDSGCGAGPRARWLEDGRIEVEGEGSPSGELPPAVLQWMPAIAAAADRYGVPRQLVAGVVASESGGQPRVHSWCCYGLMGLLPATAGSQAGRPVGAAELLSDPELNLDLGTKLLGSLMQKYGGNVLKVTAAYNAGSPRCTGKCLNRWGLRADCANGAAVDYQTRVIKFSNAALAAGGWQSPARSGLGGLLLAGLLIAAPVAVGLYWRR